MKYKIDVVKEPYEWVYACANLFKRELYTISFEFTSSKEIQLDCTKRRFFGEHLNMDLTEISSGRLLFSKSKRLTELNYKDIYELKKNFPRDLMQESFGDLIPLFYDTNKRVKSEKYKDLIPNYSLALENYTSSLLVK